MSIIEALRPTAAEAVICPSNLRLLCLPSDDRCDFMVATQIRCACMIIPPMFSVPELLHWSTPSTCTPLLSSPGEVYQLEGHLEPRALCTPSPHQLALGQPHPKPPSWSLLSQYTFAANYPRLWILYKVDIEKWDKNCKTFSGMQDATEKAFRS